MKLGIPNTMNHRIPNFSHIFFSFCFLFLLTLIYLVHRQDSCPRHFVPVCAAIFEATCNECKNSNYFHCFHNSAKTINRTRKKMHCSYDSVCRCTIYLVIDVDRWVDGWVCIFIYECLCLCVFITQYLMAALGFLMCLTHC